MTRKDTAVRLFAEHFNCSQAVFAAYVPAGAMDEATALKLATVFGAGVAATGNGLCGAVSGALLALSAKHGRGDRASVAAKVKTYELGRQFMAEFEACNGSCICENILGLNIGTPAGYQQALDTRLFETRCADCVKSAAEILDHLL